MLLAPGVFNFRKDLHGGSTQLHPAGAPDLRLRQQPATALGHIKNLSKIIEKSSKNLSKIYQNPSKINQKSTKISSWAPKGPKTPPRPFQARKREESLIPPGHHFGRILVPCWPQEPLKGLSKNKQNFHSSRSPSFIDFSSILAGFWEDLGTKLASKIH